MPTGKVKWFDTDKGFGFIADDEGGDVFVHAQSLPEGTAFLLPGAKVEFAVAPGRKGLQAMHVQVLSEPPSVAAAVHAKHRKSADEMVVIVEDLITLLDSVSGDLRRGRYPERRSLTQVATVLRAVAHDFDGAP